MDGRDEGEGGDGEDVTLQQTRPDVVPGPTGSQRLRPYRLQRYQSRGVTVALSRSTSGTLRLRPSPPQRPRQARRSDDGGWVTGQLVPAAQKLVPLEAPPARRWHELYIWLVLVVLFLLVILGGIGLDSLIASYRW